MTGEHVFVIPANSKHLAEIDYLRCIAILAVILIHTVSATARAPTSSELEIVNLIGALANGFAVPLFIFISGFVLVYSYKTSITLFYKKRFQRIIPPYIIFTIVYLIANVFKQYVITGAFQIPSIDAIVCSFLFATSNEHMWFFLIIIELYLVYPLIHKGYVLFEKKHLEVFYLLISLIAQILWSIFSGYLLPIHIGGIEIFLSNKVFLCMIFYFVAGMYISRKYETIKRHLQSPITITSFLCGIIIISIFTYSNISEIVLVQSLSHIIYAILISLLLLTISCYLTKVSAKNIFTTIGLYSFGIYLIHPLPQGFFGYILLPMINITPDKLLYYPAIFVITVVITVFCVYLIKKLPYNKYIIG